MRTKTAEPAQLVRIAVYRRVSTEEQAKGHYSMQMQQEECRLALDRRHGPGLYVAELFEDEGCPGRWGLYDPHDPKRKFRPGLTRLHEAFKQGRFDEICVYRMNRLWRRAAAAEFIQELFVPHGLKGIISCTETVDYKSASGRFQLNITSAQGAYEAEQIGEWSRDGKRRRKRDGYTNGLTFGWRRQTEEERGLARPGIALVPEKAAYVKEMADRYLAGESCRSITHWLNVCGVPTPRGAAEWRMDAVRSLLLNPVHAGLVEALDDDGQPQLIQGRHHDQRIYEPEVHHQLVARVERNRAQGGRTVGAPKYLLGGLLRCGHCGRKMNGRMTPASGTTRTYRCSAGSQQCNPDCTRLSVSAEFLEGLVVGELQRIAGAPGVVEAARKRVGEMVASAGKGLEQDIAALETRLGKLWDKYRFWSNGHSEGRVEADEFQIHLDDFRTQKAEVEPKLEDLKAKREDDAARTATLERAQEFVADFGASWAGLSIERRRELLQNVLEEASVQRVDEGNNGFTFRVRGFGTVTKRIPLRQRVGKPETGPDSLRPAEKATLYLAAQGLDVDAIAKRRGVGRHAALSTLGTVLRRLGVQDVKAAWEIVEEALEGERHCLPLDRPARRSAPPPAGTPLVTEAQAQLLALMLAGRSVKDAAAELEIIGSTPYVQLMNARDRLGVTTNEQAIAKAQELGYI